MRELQRKGKGFYCFGESTGVSMPKAFGDVILLSNRTPFRLFSVGVFTYILICIFIFCVMLSLIDWKIVILNAILSGMN